MISLYVHAPDRNHQLRYTQSAERMNARGAARVRRGHDANIQGWTEFRMAEWWRRTEAESNRVVDVTLAERPALRGGEGCMSMLRTMHWYQVRAR